MPHSRDRFVYICEISDRLISGPRIRKLGVLEDVEALARVGPLHPDIGRILRTEQIDRPVVLAPRRPFGFGHVREPQAGNEVRLAITSQIGFSVGLGLHKLDIHADG